MWWHFVEALEVSISVNVWSQAVQADVMEQVRVFFFAEIRLAGRHI